MYHSVHLQNTGAVVSECVRVDDECVCVDDECVCVDDECVRVVCTLSDDWIHTALRSPTHDVCAGRLRT